MMYPGRLPVREMKYLMAAIIRDLVGYLCQLRTVDIQLNIQVVSGPEVDLNVHSVNLTGMTVDRIRQAHHFLFEERDMFPWFFSSHLAERHALTTLDQVDDAGPMDLEEECLPERDIMFGEHCTGFENVHCLVFSANKPYQTIRHAVIDHLRDYIDLGPTSLDSMVGVLLDENISDAPTWHLDFIQQYHRAFEKDDAETDLMTGQTGHPDMADNAIRETIRRYFLSRLLGMKYRV